jgi:hypothetical protein
MFSTTITRNHMATSRLFLCLLVACALTQASGQEKAPPADTPAKETTAQDVRSHLQFLIGNFTTTTIIPPGRMAPKGATGTGTSVLKWALDSMFVLIDEEGMNNVFGKYMGHGVLGFDMQSKEYVLSMFNNFGDRPSYKGSFVGDTLVLMTKVPMPGHPFDQKLMWYKDGDAVKLKVMNDTGKGFSLVTEESATKVEAD